MNINPDCKYFKGDIPCIYHKKYNVHCKCEYYEHSFKILIIKLGAIGDVLRTTPIITRLLELYPTAEIFWLTKTPDILPDSINKLEFNFENIEVLRLSYFDCLFNLDKDLVACSIAFQVQAKVKKGFYLSNGKIVPIDENATHKYLTGIYDDLSKKNKKHYVEEIFEICDIGEFNGEKYLINVEKQEVSERKVIGINTGCSPRWNTRLWSIESYISLSDKLVERGYKVLLLGGEIENEKNIIISSKSGAEYLGYSTIASFIRKINNCDLIITQVTSALHIAIALEKRIVLLNNIFNKNEFYLYGLGDIIEPKTGCDCFYLSECKRERHCMKDISINEVLEAVEGNLW